MVQNPAMYRLDRHVSRGVKVGYRRLESGVECAVFHLPWTKTTAAEGADVVLTAMEGFLEPITALRHHLNINKAVPDSAPLCALVTVEGEWKPMTQGEDSTHRAD